MRKRVFPAAVLAAIGAAACLCGAAGSGPGSPGRGKVLIFDAASGKEAEVDRVVKSDEEWRQQLTSEQFGVTRRKGTEPAFTGLYHASKEQGIYKCIGCGTDLFDSDTKFDSGTGWPSFWAPIAPQNVRLEKDRSFFMDRIEVLCARCDAHLGHVFDDGPPPTRKRFCMNSASFQFMKRQKP